MFLERIRLHRHDLFFHGVTINFLPLLYFALQISIMVVSIFTHPSHTVRPGCIANSAHTFTSMSPQWEAAIKAPGWEWQISLDYQASRDWLLRICINKQEKKKKTWEGTPKDNSYSTVRMETVLMSDVPTWELVWSHLQKCSHVARPAADKLTRKGPSPKGLLTFRLFTIYLLYTHARTHTLSLPDLSIEKQKESEREHACTRFHLLAHSPGGSNS